MDIKKIIGINLRFLRYQSGLSQDKFYAQYGLSVKYMSQIERGEINFGIELLQAMSEAFDIPMAEFVTYDDSKIINRKRVDAKKE